MRLHRSRSADREQLLREIVELEEQEVARTRYISVIYKCSLKGDRSNGTDR